ncbi:MAG: Uncharacterised protein [Synechococcus sp. MIT S9220]|nr:MAG: Uncharacterised protein [Synechococcus sp. MIT S9220]
MLQHRFQAGEQPLPCSQCPGKGSPRYRQWNGEQGLGPDLEISEQSIAIAGVQPQHGGGDHCEREASHPGGQRLRSLRLLQLMDQFLDQTLDRWGVAAECTAGKQLPHHAAAGFVSGAAAVGQRPAAEQLTHAVWPPTLEGCSLLQQIGNGPFTLDEHDALSQQAGLKDIAMGCKAFAGEARVTEEVERLPEARDSTGAGTCRDAHGS